eukprot:9472404-Pyramimonas_sp.AAC.1
MPPPLLGESGSRAPSTGSSSKIRIWKSAEVKYLARIARTLARMAGREKALHCTSQHASSERRSVRHMRAHSWSPSPFQFLIPPSSYDCDPSLPSLPFVTPLSPPTTTTTAPPFQPATPSHLHFHPPALT